MPDSSFTDEQINEKLSKFDHVVVLMMENRSFDNLLGNLYSPTDFQSPPFSPNQQFAGLKFGGPYYNIIPEDVTDEHGGEKIFVSRAKDYFQPYPDPGETYAQINTQLFNCFNPPSNENKGDADTVEPPYNLPPPGNLLAPLMTGFIKDYLSILNAYEPKKGCIGFLWKIIYKVLHVNRKGFKLSIKYDGYSVIMQAFENDQVPVLTTLAKEFAVFDNWFCDVPSQTFPNRAFWHAGYSFGNVNNSPLKTWFLDTNGPTLFNRMQEKGLTWKVYVDSIASLTSVIHCCQLKDYFLTNFTHFTQFLNDADRGKLPAYSFIEPRIYTPGNDQHPLNYDSLDPIGNPGLEGSVLLGEKLIWDIYYAIKNSKGDANGNGNTWKNTLLIITHDEHGGCYDHVAPGIAPEPGIKIENPNNQDFAFDRLGVRVPMVMISAYVKPNTIVNSSLRHTSFLRTMCKKWGLNYLTERDRKADDFSEVINLSNPRELKDWPDIPEPIIKDEHLNHDFSNVLLNDLESVLLKAACHYYNGNTKEAEKIKTAGEAMQFLHSASKLPKALPGAKAEDLTHKWKLD